MAQSIPNLLYLYEMKPIGATVIKESPFDHVSKDDLILMLAFIVILFDVRTLRLVFKSQGYHNQSHVGL